jgi:hypothetical protein
MIDRHLPHDVNMDVVILGSNEKESHAKLKRSHSIRGGVVHDEAKFLIDNNHLYEDIPLRADRPTTTGYGPPIFKSATLAEGEPARRDVPLTVSTLAENEAPADDEAMAIGAKRLRVQVVLPSDVWQDRERRCLLLLIAFVDN